MQGETCGARGWGLKSHGKHHDRHHHHHHPYKKQICHQRGVICYTDRLKQKTTDRNRRDDVQTKNMAYEPPLLLKFPSAVILARSDAETHTHKSAKEHKKTREKSAKASTQESTNERAQNPKGPKIEKFQSRLKNSLSIEHFNPDLQNSPQK